MKKTLKLLVLLPLLCGLSVISGCNKDDDKFNWPMETLHGTWDGTHVKSEATGNWVDITGTPSLRFSIRFNPDGTYSGSGAFGTGNGTYTAKGNTIITYVGGQEYARYIVRTLTGTNAELTMHMGTSSMDIRVRKR